MQRARQYSKWQVPSHSQRVSVEDIEARFSPARWIWPSVSDTPRRTQIASRELLRDKNSGVMGVRQRTPLIPAQNSACRIINGRQRHVAGDI